MSVSLMLGLLALVSVSGDKVEAQPPKPEAAVKEHKICKKFASTGSRLGSDRVCLTKSQWDAREEEERREARSHSDK